MNFAGLDLAWGERSGTGLCVLSREHVVDATRLRSLDDIVSWLTPTHLVTASLPSTLRSTCSTNPVGGHW